MNRREAIQRVAVLMGGTVVGASLFLEGCHRSASKDVETLFDPKSIDFLGDLAEAILPRTKTPGAKEVGVGVVIPIMVRDCYSAEEQAVFLAGIAGIDERAKREFRKRFQLLEMRDQTAFVDILDREAQDYDRKKMANELPHFFTMLKQLTLLTFFTSKLGATEVFRYVKIPGRYDGHFPYQKGDHAWAT